MDALVVERSVRRKKTRGGAGVFQYAQTVEDGVWKDEKTQKDIQDRISRLAKENTAKAQITNVPVQTDSIVDTPSSPTCLRKEKTRRYTIVSPEENEPSAKRAAASPPKVYASKDLVKHPPVPDFRLYDAILSERESVLANQPDPEMEKFLPMLNDYLKIHDIPTHAELNTFAAASNTKHGKDAFADESDDYVWDVFYHRPASLSEWNSVAARMGTITGLPGSVLGSDESDSGSEAEDEADEDSNAEEYYKNDYPDEESDSEPENSDEFHEESDYDDMMHYRDDEEAF